MSEEENELLRRTGSMQAVAYFRNRSYRGRMEDPEAYTSYTGPCGETLELYLKIKDGNIEDAKFQYEGCSGLASCGTALCELIIGKTIPEAEQVTQQDVLNTIKAVPVEDFDCPFLAAKTLARTIEQYKKGYNRK